MTEQSNVVYVLERCEPGESETNTYGKAYRSPEAAKEAARHLLAKEGCGRIVEEKPIIPRRQDVTLFNEDNQPVVWYSVRTLDLV